MQPYFSRTDLDRTMLKTCFDHVCGQIVNLVEKQIEDVEERGDSVKVMIFASLVISFRAATH